jgi:hypothetical protein
MNEIQTSVSKPKGRWSHITAGAWIGGIVLGALLMIPFLYLKFGSCDWLKASSPFLFEHRKWVAIVYIALCYGLFMWLGKVFSERHRRLHGTDQPQNADNVK